MALALFSVEVPIGAGSWGFLPYSIPYTLKWGIWAVPAYIYCVICSDSVTEEPKWFRVSSVQLLSRVWLSVTPRTAASHETYPVHHQLPESTQTHVPRVGDAIQPSQSLLSPSPPALNLSQHQGLFQWVSSLHQVAKVLEFQLQHQSLQWTLRTDLL